MKKSSTMRKIKKKTRKQRVFEFYFVDKDTGEIVFSKKYATMEAMSEGDLRLIIDHFRSSRQHRGDVWRILQ